MRVKHGQLLEKLSAAWMVQALDQEIADLVAWHMAARHQTSTEVADAVLSPLLDRWNHVLQAGADAVSPHYRDKVLVALATLLHKYGCADAELTARACRAIDALAEGVVLRDAFARQADTYKRELTEPPAPLKRRPARADAITFFRPRDVIVIALDGRHHAAYVHKLTGLNESPVIEFYEGAFDNVPTLSDLAGARAVGPMYDDGVPRIGRYSVHRLTYEPDPAHQVHLIAACVDTPPPNDHLAQPIRLRIAEDISSIQRVIRKLYRNG